MTTSGGHAEQTAYEKALYDASAAMTDTINSVADPGERAVLAAAWIKVGATLSGYLDMVSGLFAARLAGRTMPEDQKQSAQRALDHAGVVLSVRIDDVADPDERAALAAAWANVGAALSGYMKGALAAITDAIPKPPKGRRWRR